MKRSYYDLLRVPRNAPPEALQQAYRALISRAVNAPPDQAEALGNEVKLARRAFAELMHPEKRAAYDAYLKEEERREGFVRGPAQYVPDRFRHDGGRRSGKTVWATVITVLALLCIGAVTQHIASNQREMRVQQAAQDAARARKREEIQKANAPAPPDNPAPAGAGEEKQGR